MSGSSSGTDQYNTSPSGARGGFNWQDVIAGLSIAGLLLPQAVAYSGIAGLPPEAGVIALFAGLVGYGLLGTSRFAVVSATSSSAAVLAVATISIADGHEALRLSLAVGLTLLTGVFFLLAGLMRMGGITSFIARPVLRGFTFALAIDIILKQMPGMIGIHTAVHGNIFGLLQELAARVDVWNLVAAMIGVVTLVLLIMLSRYRHVPAGVIVILLGIAVDKWLDLSRYQVGLVGDIHLQLAMPSLPLLTQPEWMHLGMSAMAIAMLLYTESYTSIRNFSLQYGDTVTPNRDLLVLGVCNLFSGLFHGMPVGAGYSATAANEAAGATSRLAGWVAAMTMLVVVLTMLPLIAMIPKPVLAAITIYSVAPSLNLMVFRTYFAWRRDRLVIISAIMGVLLFGVLNGLLMAVAISLVITLRQFSESSILVLGQLEENRNFVDIKMHPEARPVPGIMILRPDEPLFFANAERIRGKMQDTIAAQNTDLPVHTIIVSLDESADLDGTSLEALQAFQQAVSDGGRQLLLVHLNSTIYRLLQQINPPVVPVVSLSELGISEAVSRVTGLGSTAQSAIPPASRPIE